MDVTGSWIERCGFAVAASTPGQPLHDRYDQAANVYDSWQQLNPSR